MRLILIFGIGFVLAGLQTGFFLSWGSSWTYFNLIWVVVMLGLAKEWSATPVLGFVAGLWWDFWRMEYLGLSSLIFLSWVLLYQLLQTHWVRFNPVTRTSFFMAGLIFINLCLLNGQLTEWLTILVLAGLVWLLCELIISHRQAYVSKSV